MEPREEINRREFLSIMSISLAVPAVKITGTGERARTSVHKIYVILVNSIPMFVCNGRPILKPVFETYVPTQYYFRQFAEAGISHF
jgi:hypothetical protein